MPMNLQKNNSTTNYDNEFGVEPNTYGQSCIWMIQVD